MVESVPSGARRKHLLSRGSCALHGAVTDIGWRSRSDAGPTTSSDFRTQPRLENKSLSFLPHSYPHPCKFFDFTFSCLQVQSVLESMERFVSNLNDVIPCSILDYSSST